MCMYMYNMDIHTNQGEDPMGTGLKQPNCFTLAQRCLVRHGEPLPDGSGEGWDKLPRWREMWKGAEGTDEDPKGVCTSKSL